MKTTITIEIDTDRNLCTIEETSAEQAGYDISTDSLESMAYDVGEAVSDYIQGLG